MMRDEARETLDKLGDTIIGEMLIVKDLMDDRDRWKRRAKIYHNLCRGLPVANVETIGSQLVHGGMKTGRGGEE